MATLSHMSHLADCVYVAIGLKVPTEAKLCLNPATTLYMYAQGWNVHGLYK